MPKRSRSDDNPHSKRHKHDLTEKQTHTDAVAALPAPTTTPGHIPAYTIFTVPTGLPPLPPITDPSLAKAVFTHKSAVGSYNRSAARNDTTYERLEFLGDAQIEHMASRLIFSRFSHLPAGQQSQLRELLVKNETLAEYARAYGFDARVAVGSSENNNDALIRSLQEDARARGNKGFNKILGDVLEAYVAAVVLSHGDDGFALAEAWLTALWAPKLLEAVRRDRAYDARSMIQPPLHTPDDADLSKVYSPTAKADLQRRILGGPATKLSYEAWKPSEELKGDQLGQNRHYIALYLTGYGYERHLLGKGEGKNKVEAGNWAATQAMHGEAKGIVEDCAAQIEVIREKKRAEAAAAQTS